MELNINTNGCDTLHPTSAYFGHEAFAEADMCTRLAKTTAYGGGYMYTGQHVTVDGEDLGSALCHTVNSYDMTDTDDCKAWAWKIMQDVKAHGGVLTIVTDDGSGISRKTYCWKAKRELWEQGVVEFFERSRS